MLTERKKYAEKQFLFFIIKKLTTVECTAAGQQEHLFWLEPKRLNTITPLLPGLAGE
jgi:hypothetical protein